MCNRDQAGRPGPGPEFAVVRAVTGQYGVSSCIAPSHNTLPLPAMQSTREDARGRVELLGKCRRAQQAARARRVHARRARRKQAAVEPTVTDAEIEAHFGTAVDTPVEIVDDWVYRYLASWVFTSEEVFLMACGSGNLANVKFMLTTADVENSPHNRTRGFRHACGCGHLHIAKWLVAQGGVHIHSQQDSGFRAAVYSHHWDVCRWLMSLDARADWPALPVPFGTWARFAWMRACVTACHNST